MAQTYINLNLPASIDTGNPRRVPIVLSATDKQVIVARTVFMGPNDDQRIQIIEIQGDHWSYHGSNGRDINKSGNWIIHDGAKSPDGRLWILAETVRFPAIDGNRFGLFVLDKGVWRLVGPRIGDPETIDSNAMSLGGVTLHFFKDNIPVIAWCSQDFDHKLPSWKSTLSGLEMNQGTSFIHNEVKYDMLHPVFYSWRASDAWLVQPNYTNRLASIDVSIVSGLERGERSRPWSLKGAKNRMYTEFCVSQACDIAAVSSSRTPPGHFASESIIEIYHLNMTNKSYSCDATPSLPDPESSLANLGWSPSGVLHVAKRSRAEVAIYKYQDGKWQKIYAMRANGLVRFPFENPRLCFRSDSVPILTWGE